MTTAPTLHTDRLTLRHHILADVDAYWQFYETSTRLQYMDCPKNKTHLWYGLGSEIASWQLQGFGGWAITLKDGTLIGQVAISHPPHFPETELGWYLLDGYEGQGYAFEAATAARDWAFQTAKLPTLVSYIDRRNARSIALAQRLGATEDPTAQRYDDADTVYRHNPTPQTVSPSLSPTNSRRRHPNPATGANQRSDA